MLALLAEAAAIQIEGLDSMSDSTAHAMTSVVGELIPLAAVTLTLIMPVLLVLVVQMNRTKRMRMQNELILKLADKGAPIPPELFLEPQQRGRSDLRSGLSLIAIGIGLAVGFSVSGGYEGAGFALIPFFIGLARLAAWQLERRAETKL